ncbi:MAG: hypothetical protein QNI84_06460 [Henriciella sp.]|nr:hypothetical protein [Henriciella sp.]
MSNEFRYTACAALAAALLPLSGAAAEAGWQLGNSNPYVSADDGPVEDGLFVFAEDVGGASLALACSEDIGLQAVLFEDGATMDAMGPMDLQRASDRPVKITTKSTKPRRADWSYVRAVKGLVSQEGWQARRIFNATIRGEEVKLYANHSGNFTLSLPAVDSNFTTFAKTCSATKG